MTARPGLLVAIVICFVLAGWWGGVRFPRCVGKVQTNALAHAFPRAIFVTLLPLSSSHARFDLRELI